MILEIRHLELMAAVAEHGTLTRASRELHVSQSALSHLLGNLEARLRTALFHRVGRRMVPTAAGLRLLDTARATIPHLQRAEEDLSRLSGGGGGVVRISTECYTCYHWLPALLQRLRTRTPGIEVQIVADATRAPGAALLEGRIDLAIVTSATSPHFRSFPLFRDRLVAIMPPGHRLAERAYLNPADLGDEHLLTYAVPRSELAVFTEFLDPAGVHPASVSRIELTEAILEMVRAGLGISVLAHWAAQPALTRRALIAKPLGRPPLSRQWSAVIVRSKRTPQHLETFVEA
ncbi:MAG TPA: LysR family transcriptional regulator, partial [Gemmatimonadales bacterium]|nr:LysR family transcriptional regulator [Gemmatimonadales bacterium]